MAFGFFKKTQTADKIFYNGQIHTGDPDFPWAEAVACTDGKITAVGDFDAMDSLIGRDTEKIDLNGQYLFPGFIDTHRSPVMQVFEGKYVSLSDCKTKEEICDKVSSWAQENPQQEVIFGYGFIEDLEPEKEDLDVCCADRPVVLLAESGIGCAVNTVAEEIIEETAEEECVEVVTVSYVLNLLMPFDFEQVELDVQNMQEKLSKQGITTVLNQQTPDYLESLYQDSMVALYNEEQLRQRFCGSYLMNRPLQPRGVVYQLMRRKTNCSELTDVLQANTINVSLNETNCPMEFTEDALDQILLDVVDKGFQIFIEAYDIKDLRKAYAAAEHIRNKGYKNSITIASDAQLSADELLQFEHAENINKTCASQIMSDTPVVSFCNASCNASRGSSAEFIEEMTVRAAKIIGMENQLGKIEKGFMADFAVFKENPLDQILDDFLNKSSVMTVLGGEIVYKSV